MNLVLHHVLEPLIVSWAKEDHDFKLSPIEPVVHDLVSSELVPLLMKCLGDLLDRVLSAVSNSLKGCGVTLSSSESTNL